MHRQHHQATDLGMIVAPEHIAEDANANQDNNEIENRVIV
jgi:hypothetical protein